MAGGSNIDVTLSAIDKITGPINAIQRRIDRLTAPLGRISRGISDIGSAAGFGRLHQSIGRIGNALGNVTRQVGMLGAGLGALGGISFAGTVGVTKSVADLAKEVQNLSTVSGLSPEVFQKLAYGAQSVGVESDKLGDILKDVNDKLGDFRATGGGEMADFFEKIAPKVGLSIKSFKDLSSADALQLYVRALERANVSQAEMTFYLEAIANDASLLAPLLQDGAKGFHNLSREAERTGAVLSAEDLQRAADFRAAVASVEGRFRAFRNAFGVGLMGPLEDAIAAVTEWTDANQALIRTNIDDWAVRIGGVFRDIANPASDLRKEIRALGDRLAGWANKLAPVVDFLGGPMNAALVGLGTITFAPLVASLATLTAAVATLGVTLLATPIGWFLGAAALIGGAAYIIWRDWEALPQQFADMWLEFGDAFGAVDEVVSRGAAWVDETFAGWYAATNTWLAALETRLWSGGASFVQSLWDGLRSRWAAFSAWVQGSFDTAKAKALDLGYGIVDAIIEGITSQWERLRAFLHEKIAALTDFMPDWMSSKLDFTAGLEQSVTETTRSVDEVVERTTVTSALAPEAAGHAVGDLPARVTPDVGNLSARVVNSASVAPVAPIPSLPDPARFGPAASPSTIETATVSAGRVDVSSFEAPEPFVLHQPQTVNAPFNGGAITIYEASDASAVRQEIERALRAQAERHRVDIASTLSD